MPPMKVRLLNCHSAFNKATFINNYIIESQLDVVCITETWLKLDDGKTVTALTPLRYML